MADPLRVLLIDDNPDDRALVLRELKTEFPGVQTTDVTEAEELHDALDRGGFSLVITDFQLRWTDGLRVLGLIRVRHPNCPVIMCTATGSEEIAVEAMKNGLDDYVIKNVHHLVRLGATARSVLERSQTRRRAAEVERRLATVLAQLNVGVFRCTTQGELLEANEAYLKLVGQPSLEAARSLTPAQLLLRHQSCAQVFRRLQIGQPQEHEIQLLDAHGNPMWIRLCAALASTRDDDTVVDGLAEDITLRKRTEEEARARLAASERLAVLSPREREVLFAIVAGMANKTIAQELAISEKTVEKHRASLMKKLKVRSVAQLVRLAVATEPPR